MLGRTSESLLVVFHLVVTVLLLGGGVDQQRQTAQAFSCSKRNDAKQAHHRSNVANKRTFFYSGGRSVGSRRVNLLSTRGIQQDKGVSSSDADEEEKTKQTLRTRLRQITGFSLTAFRATMRAATGVSMTAVYASTLAFSGQWIRQTMKFVLSIFPAWARYFVQPILILYYLPLFTLRNLTGPNRRRGLEKPHALVDGWNQAIVTADNESSALWDTSDDDEDDTY